MKKRGLITASAALAFSVGGLFAVHWELMPVNAMTVADVTVLPGDGGELPLVNRLVLRDGDTALTTVQANAGKRSTITTNAKDVQRVVIKDVQATDTITANYGVVGTYAGKQITAKATISNIQPHDNKHKAPSKLTAKDIALNLGPGFSSGIASLANIAQLKVSYEFFDATTGKVLNIDHAFLTMSSLDGPVTDSTTGFEYATYLGAGRVYRVENSIVRPINNPLDSTQVVMAGQMNRPSAWPYTTASGATFEVSGTKLNFIYGSTRVKTDDTWVSPMLALSTVTLGAPTIPAPSLQASTASKSVNAGDQVTYELTQPVNTLNEDLANRYASWQEMVQLPKETKYQSATVVDAQGNALPTTDYTVQYDATTHQVSFELTKAGLANRPFSGESYHFKVTTQVNADVNDQTQISVTGQSTINGKTQNAASVSQVVTNQVPITVHYYMTDSEDKVAPDQIVSAPYGKQFTLKPLATTPTGYTYNASQAINTAGMANSTTPAATFYYDANPYDVHVHYLLKDGQVLDNLDVTGLYGDTYTTTASDYDDLYTLVTEKMPTNATGDVTEKPINVNYYYRPTTGQWVDVGNQGSILTRTDYHGKVRSISQNYNTGTGYTVQFNQDAPQVAITVGNSDETQADQDHVFNYGAHYTYTASNGETVTFNVAENGQVKVDQHSTTSSTQTEFDQSGQIQTTAQTVNDDGTKSSQTNTIDGVQSKLTAETFTQTLPNGDVVQAERLPASAKASAAVPVDKSTDESVLISQNATQLPVSPALTAPAVASTDNSSALGTASVEHELPQLTTGIVATNSPEVAGTNDFHTGVPINTPVFADDTNVSPNNNQDTDAASVPASMQAKVTYMRAGKTLAIQDLSNNQPEETLYSNDDEGDGVEVDAGVDQNGFYIDAFDGDKGHAYTLGNGYEWQAETNDVPPDNTDAVGENSKNSGPNDVSRQAAQNKPMLTSTTVKSGAKDTNKGADNEGNKRPENKKRLTIAGISLPQLGNATTWTLIVVGLVLIVTTLAASLVHTKRKRVNH